MKFFPTPTTYHDIEEINANGYITAAQANELLEVMHSNLKVKLINQDYFKNEYSPINHPLYHERIKGQLIPALVNKIHDGNIHLYPTRAYLKNLDFEETIYVFDKSKIEEIGKRSILVNK